MSPNLTPCANIPMVKTVYTPGSNPGALKRHESPNLSGDTIQMRCTGSHECWYDVRPEYLRSGEIVVVQCPAQCETSRGSEDLHVDEEPENSKYCFPRWCQKDPVAFNKRQKLVPAMQVAKRLRIDARWWNVWRSLVQAPVVQRIEQ